MPGTTPWRHSLEIADSVRLTAPYTWPNRRLQTCNWIRGHLGRSLGQHTPLSPAGTHSNQTKIKLAGPAICGHSKLGSRGELTTHLVQSSASSVVRCPPSSPVRHCRLPWSSFNLLLLFIYCDPLLRAPWYVFLSMTPGALPQWGSCSGVVCIPRCTPCWRGSLFVKQHGSHSRSQALDTCRCSFRAVRLTSPSFRCLIYNRPQPLWLTYTSPSRPSPNTLPASMFRRSPCSHGGRA